MGRHSQTIQRHANSTNSRRNDQRILRGRLCRLGVSDPIGMQRAISAAGIDEFVMGTHFDDAPRIHHDDHIGSFGRRQPVRN